MAWRVCGEGGACTGHLQWQVHTRGHSLRGQGMWPPCKNWWRPCGEEVSALAARASRSCFSAFVGPFSPTCTLASVELKYSPAQQQQPVVSTMQLYHTLHLHSNQHNDGQRNACTIRGWWKQSAVGVRAQQV
jgi:hypothetical protein